MKILKCIEFETMENNTHTHTSNTLLQKCMRMINIRFEVVVTSEEWMGVGIPLRDAQWLSTVTYCLKKKIIRYVRMLGLIS